MKLCVKSLVLTAVSLWCGLVFAVGVANMIWPTYGVAFLQVLDSIYPGYHATGSFGSVVVATLYGAVDGAICVFLFGLIYNRLARPCSSETEAA